VAEIDWTECDDGLATASLLGGVTAGETPPSGGGTFVYGFRSASAVTGARALVTNQADYYPITTPASAGGGSISGAIKRGLSSVTTGFSPMFFLGVQASGPPPPSVLDEGYIIGLEDNEPHRVVVRKGRITDGVPAATSENSLMRSLATESIDTWWHIMLDMIVNLSGDVVLRVFRNDLSTNLVTNPTWEELEMEGANDGINGFIDDALGANSGSLPFTSGYAGFAGQVSEQARRVYFDQIVIARQLP